MASGKGAESREDFIGIRMGDYRGKIMVVEGMNNKGVEENF